MSNLFTSYDPSIQGLLSECEADWGDPTTNTTMLVPYGIRPIDLALYGIDTVNGETILIMGQEKHRKTTAAINILANYMTSVKPVIKPFTVVDSLESGMHPKRYRDTIISNMATRFLLEQNHRAREFCPACSQPKCRQLGISPEFLRYNSRTPEQLHAIEFAIDTMMSWPLHLYGANPYQGDTRSLSNAVMGLDARWLSLIENGAKIFFVDHVQQYSFMEQTTDYEKQLRAIAAISDLVAQYNMVAIVLSQVSLTSVRDSRNGNGKIGAAGGQKAAQEANVVLATSYEPGSGEMRIAIEESRKSNTFSVWQPIDDTSGAFYGTAMSATERSKDNDS